ncbi:MAG: enoyl-CoA hydratase/isomerase family protein [Microbacterium sp.]
MSTPEHTDHVRFTSVRGLGRIVLSRPRAINALSYDMTEAIHATLSAWESDPDVDAVLITGEGERGLCAGGDVRALQPFIAAGSPEEPERGFRSEYRINAQIGAYPKPVVSVMHGVTMGGGVGIGAHARVRIVTESSLVAMPETRLGFTPDAGGSWRLAHAPGRIGEYLALTSETMGPADAIACGFADFFVATQRLDDLVDALAGRADPQTPAELAMLFDETPEPSRFERDREWIDEAFSAGTAEEIIERLRALGGEGPVAALAALEARAPLAVKVTLESVRRSRSLPSLAAAIEQEYGLVSWFVRTQPDMAEGIRAQLVDKDLSPRWTHASIADVPDTLVDEAFAHEPPVPLWG